MKLFTSLTKFSASGMKEHLKQYFSNPAVGIFGSIASIISIPLAVFFYFGAKDNRELVYFVHPSRTVLVESARPSDLKLIYEGREILTDVVTIQLSIWNRDRASIRPENLLSPLEIRLKPPSAILKVSLGRKSRDLIGFSAAETVEMLKEGRVPVNFKILENGDGSNVEIIFAGPRETLAEVVGTIEGQGAPGDLSDPTRYSPQNKVGYLQTLLGWIALVFLMSIGVTIAIYGEMRLLDFIVAWLWSRPANPGTPTFSFFVAVGIVSAAVIILYSVLHSWLTPPNPALWILI